MAKLRSKDILPIEEFGNQLIRTGDLDPVYIALFFAELSPGQLYRLLLAYWLFYHLGFSAWVSELKDKDYWLVVRRAARNLPGSSPRMHDLNFDRWPRGVERRHFRGQKCVRAVDWFSNKSPEKWVDSLTGNDVIPDAVQVMNRVREWPLCGPWIAYKVADMLERVVGENLRFPEDVCLLYKEPRSALLRLNRKDPKSALEYLIDYFGRKEAPPTFDRSCGYSEVETILCKWKAQETGYWVGKDIHEVGEGLKGWGKTADKLRAALPKEVER